MFNVAYGRCEMNNNYTCAKYDIRCNAIEVCLCETEMCPAQRYGIATHPITKTLDEVIATEYEDIATE